MKPGIFVAVAPLCALVLASCVLSIEPEQQATAAQKPMPSESGAFLDGFFPIGVFSQPTDSFAKWKARGINTLLEVPQNHDPAAWDAAARKGGFRIIRRPLASPQSDIGRTDLLAWSHWDEPDAAGRIFEWTPMFEKTYAEWRRIDANRKIFINFAGPDLTWFTASNDEYSRRYASYYPRLVATADWVASDLYPSAGYLNRAHASRRGDVTLLAEPIRVLRGMTSKPQFAFIEASDIERGNVAGAQCATALQVRAQIWYAILHGVRGIFYFPAVVGTGGFRFDGVPETIVQEMVRQNALITQVAPTLQTEVNPASVSVAVNTPLEAGWRRGSGQSLMIVVNPSARPVRMDLRATGLKDGAARVLSDGRTLTISGGRLGDDIEAYGIRVISVPR